uniref:Uncharacterized protein n=1 Tax=Nelumbo nucifera TaxID=4432 RepID=A0A822XZK1_NELNU|nr:TPA_asm: hypothetical protein HUJ06_025943 [Nelumbo nucifera]
MKETEVLFISVTRPTLHFFTVKTIKAEASSPPEV